MKTITSLSLALILVISSVSALAGGAKAPEKYVIVRNTMNGIGSVQPETSRPYLGIVIGSYDSKEAALKALAELKKAGKVE